MARLTIEQVAAPNFSASAQLLAGAGQSFNQGLSAASSLLDKYAAGQQANGDQAIIADIAGLNSEEELGAYLQSGALNGRNLSPEMRQNILGLRDNIIGYGQGRADVAQTQANTVLTGANTNRVNAGTAIANAAEGRTAAEYQDGVQTRDQMRALTPLALAAGADGRQYGEPAAGATQDTRLMLARTLQMEAGNQGLEGMIDVGSVIRNRAASGRYGEGVEGVIMRPGQFSAWNGVTGYAGGEQGQNTNFTPNADALAAADAVLSGQYQDRTGGATHYYAELPNSPAPSWTNDSFRRVGGGDHYFGDADGVGAVNGNNGPIANNPGTPQRPSNGAASPAMTALQEAIAASPNISFDQAQALIQNALTQQQNGQTRLDATEAERVGNVQAGAALGALTGDAVTPGGAVLQGIQAGQDANLTPSQILAGMGTTRDVATTNADILAPTVTQDPLLAAQAESDARTRQRGVDALPQTRMLATAERYGDDAVGGLVADLGIGADGEDATSYVFGLFGEDADNNTLRQHINTIAEQAGVTPAMAAAAMADEFTRDPWGVNRNSKRFDPQDVVNHLNATVGPEGMQAYEGALVNQQTDDARTQAAQLQLGTLQTQLAKTQDPVRRTQLQSQISELSTAIRTADVQGPAPTADAQLQQFLQTSEEDFARQLSRATPGSDEHNQILTNMIQAIESSPQMSRSQKTLLIERIRG